jgi:hypothetical protein
MSFVDRLLKRMFNVSKATRLGMSENLLPIGKQVALIVF